MGGRVHGPHTQEHQGTVLEPERCQSETEKTEVYLYIVDSQGGYRLSIINKNCNFKYHKHNPDRGICGVRVLPSLFASVLY